MTDDRLAQRTIICCQFLDILTFIIDSRWNRARFLIFLAAAFYEPVISRIIFGETVADSFFQVRPEFLQRNLSYTNTRPNGNVEHERSNTNLPTVPFQTSTYITRPNTNPKSSILPSRLLGKCHKVHEVVRFSSNFSPNSNLAKCLNNSSG